MWRCGDTRCCCAAGGAVDTAACLAGRVAAAAAADVATPAQLAALPACMTVASGHAAAAAIRLKVLAAGLWMSVLLRP